jgi:hypothetical protein
VPFGHQLIEGDRSGAEARKRLGVNDNEPDIMRLIDRVCLYRNGGGPLGMKNVATHLNRRCISRHRKRWTPATSNGC